MQVVASSAVKQLHTPWIYTTLSACFIMTSLGTSFAWVTPTLAKLTSENSEIPMTPSEMSWMIAIIELGNLISPIPAGILADKFGRKLISLLTGPISIASWLIMLHFKSLAALCLGRILQGLVIGIVFTVMPMYLGEIASKDLRGTIITLTQASFWFGFVYEYVLGPFVSFETLIMFNIILPVAFLIFFSAQPESPYFQIMCGKEKKAKISLMSLRGTTKEEDVKEELLEITRTVKQEMSKKASFADLVATAPDRNALMIVQVVNAIKLMSGTVPILVYSTDIFQRSGFTLVPPFITTIIMGLVLFTCSFFSSTLTDNAGRRPMLIISSVGCAFSLAFISAFFYFHDKSNYDLSGLTWITPAGIIVFNLFMTLGLDPVSMTYRSEMFPAHTRSTAASVNTIVFTVGAFIHLKFYHFIAGSFGVYVIFMIFSISSFLGSIWIYFYAIETKNKSLAEIQQQLGNGVC